MSDSVARPAAPGAPLQAALALHKAGRLEAAEAGYRALLAEDPNDLDALHLLGALLVQSGRPREAIEAVQRAVAQRGNAPALHNTLGLAYQAEGNEAAAESAFRQALALRPGYAEAHVNLGNLLRRRGDKLGALEHYRRAVAGNPMYAEAAGYLGVLLADLGRPGEALAPLERAVAARPGNAELLVNLGAVLAELGRPEAEQRYRQALALAPDHALALSNLGRLLLAKGRYAEAVACVEKAVAAAPDNARYRFQLAKTLERAKRPREAMARFEEFLATDPQDVDAWIGLARACKALGRPDEAQAHYQHALELDPHDDAVLQAIAAGNLAVPPGAEIVRLEQATQDPDMPAERRRLRHAALAAWYEGSAEYERAFEHMAAFNRLRAETLNATGGAYDGAVEAAAVNRTIAAFGREHFRRVAGWGDGSELPDFIVGMPHAGGRLVARILAGHAQVRAAGELRKISAIARNLPREMAAAGLGAAGEYPLCAAALTAQITRDMAGRHLEFLRDIAPGAARAVDSRPDNYRHLGLIATLFPEARIIHCRRDPLDACLACYSHEFEGDRSWACDLAALGQHYRQYDRLMGHWRETLPRPPLEVVYEDMVAEPEKAARAIVAFCGLEWEVACLRALQPEDPAGAAGERPNLVESVGRWRRYERHLGPLIAALGDCR